MQGPSKPGRQLASARLFSLVQLSVPFAKADGKGLPAERQAARARDQGLRCHAHALQRTALPLLRERGWTRAAAKQARPNAPVKSRPRIRRICSAFLAPARATRVPETSMRCSPHFTLLSGVLILAGLLTAPSFADEPAQAKDG